MGNLLKKIAILILIAILVLYLCYTLILPRVVNSTKITKYIENTLNNKFNQTVTLKNFHINTKFNLETLINIEEFDNQFLKIKQANINLKPFPLKIKDININELYFDKSKFKPNKSDSSFNISKLPIINVKKAVFNLDSGNIINIQNFTSKQIENKIFYDFQTKIDSLYIKNQLNITSKDNLYIENGQVIAQNFKIPFKENFLNINGKIYSKNGHNFKLTGNELDARLIQEYFLFFMKQKNKNQKNFIENFYDFKGVANIDLTFKQNSIEGQATLNNFGAKYVIFSLPLYFKKATFNFNGNNITLKEQGLVGKEKLTTHLTFSDIFSPKRKAIGGLNAIVGSNFAKTFILNTKIISKADLTINYLIQNKQPEVEYIIKSNKDSNIYYKNSHLENLDKDKTIYIKTKKKENDLYLKNIEYSIEKDGIKSQLISGNGLFIRKNNKYNLDFIEIQTHEYLPTTLLSAFIKDLNCGRFSTKARYSANNKKFTGILSLKEAKYKDFLISNALADANNNTIKINAQGKYQNEDFSANLDIANDFKKITINNIELYLKEYKIKKNKNKPKSKKKYTLEEKIKKTNLTIKKGKIILDKLIFKQIVLQNLELNGFMEDNMVYFSMPNIDFANGTLGAQGIYDLLYHSSDIDFNADKIDSNSAASMIFNLKNQFEGFANAKMNTKTYNHLQYIDADANFTISQGALTKLGSTEFIIKNSKIKLNDLINIDLNKMKALKSDIYGSFKLNNNMIEQIEIYNQNKSLSLFAQGDYNISNEIANLKLWGKYDKEAQKGIRILYVPLSWITKFAFKNENSKEMYKKEINKIPSINAKKNSQEIFMVDVKGNLNNAKKLDIKLKSIK